MVFQKQQNLKIKSTTKTTIFLIDKKEKKTMKQQIKNNELITDRFRIKSKMTRTEIGRSMVEMLGVLVITGVLSVGGLVGYSYAMSKWRANNIVHELELVSYSLSMQFNTNAQTLMLGDPYDNGHIESETYDFAYGCGNNMNTQKNCSASEKNYWMSLNGVPKNVCTRILELFNGVVYLSEKRLNNSVITDDFICSDSGNLMAFIFNIVQTGQVSDTENTQKPNVNCPANTAVTGLGGLAVVMTDEATEKKANCYCHEINTKYNADTGICEEQPNICTTNSDCNRGFYCQITQYKTETNNTYCTNDTSGMIGECRDIKADLMDKPENVPFWMSNTTMNWWSVKYFCEAQEKSMVNFEDFGCANTICKSGCSASSGYCRIAPDSSTSERTEVMENMYVAYGNPTDKAWINMDYSTCYPYYVQFDRNRIDFMGRTGKNRAICK